MQKNKRSFPWRFNKSLENSTNIIYPAWYEIFIRLLLITDAVIAIYSIIIFPDAPASFDITAGIFLVVTVSIPFLTKFHIYWKFKNYFKGVKGFLKSCHIVTKGEDNTLKQLEWECPSDLYAFKMTWKWKSLFSKSLEVNFKFTKSNSDSSKTKWMTINLKKKTIDFFYKNTNIDFKHKEQKSHYGINHFNYASGKGRYWTEPPHRLSYGTYRIVSDEVPTLAKLKKHMKKEKTKHHIVKYK